MLRREGEVEYSKRDDEECRSSRKGERCGGGLGEEDDEQMEEGGCRSGLVCNASGTGAKRSRGGI